MSIAFRYKVEPSIALENSEPIRLLTRRTRAINCMKCFRSTDMPRNSVRVKLWFKGHAHFVGSDSNDFSVFGVQTFKGFVLDSPPVDVCVP